MRAVRPDLRFPPFVKPRREIPRVRDYRLDQCLFFGLSVKKPMQFSERRCWLRSARTEVQPRLPCAPVTDWCGRARRVSDNVAEPLFAGLVPCYGGVGAAPLRNPCLQGGFGSALEAWTRPPPTQSAAPCWGSRVRWRLVLMTTCAARGHNNIRQLRGFALLLRRLSRLSASRRQKYLCTSDPRLSIGVLSKGRPPSGPISRLARQAAAALLICEIHPHLRYVQSK